MNARLEERQARRAARRPLERSTPPVVAASMYVDIVGSDGVVGRYIFPGSGTIRGASAFAETFPSGDTLTFKAETECGAITQVITFTIGRNGGSTELDIDIVAGTRLTIRTQPGAVGAYVGFLWQLGEA